MDTLARLALPGIADARDVHAGVPERDRNRRDVEAGHGNRDRRRLSALIGVLSQTLLPKKPEGLIAAYEMMVVTPAIQNLIRENKIYRIDSSIQTGRKHGMFLLDEHMFKLWKEGLVDKEEILMRSSKPAELAAKIAAYEKGLYEEEEFEDEEDTDEEEDEYEDEEQDEEEEDRRPRKRR